MALTIDLSLLIDPTYCAHTELWTRSIGGNGRDDSQDPFGWICCRNCHQWFAWWEMCDFPGVTHPPVPYITLR